jgi:hypothetical protein
MSDGDIVRSIAVDHDVLLESPRGNERIPMWMVESIVSLTVQPSYQDAVDPRGSHEINVEHLRSDLIATYHSGKVGDVAIAGSVASDIGSIPPGEKIIIAYRDSTDSIRIEVGEAVGPLSFVRVDSVVRDQRIRQIVARPIPTSSIGLFRGLTDRSLMFSLAVSGVMQFRQNRKTIAIPLWKIESVVIVRDQRAYLEYVEPMNLALQILLIGGLVILFGAILFLLAGGKEMTNVDLYW